jgi:hypothetical protein
MFSNFLYTAAVWPRVPRNGISLNDLTMTFLAVKIKGAIVKQEMA